MVMMNRAFLPFFALLLVGLTACNEGTSETPQSSPEETETRFSSPAVETSFQEVMAIHDEVMPNIPQMKRDRKRLEGHRDQLASQGAAAAEDLAQTELAIQLLADGDSLMFDWMKRFKTPTKTMPEAEALPYLAKKKAKVTVVNEAMKKGMSAAKAILDQIEE